MNKLVNNENLKQTSKLILDKNKSNLDNYKNDVNKEIQNQNQILNKLEYRTHIGEELDYGLFIPSYTGIINLNNPVAFKENNNKNIEHDINCKYFKLKVGKTYEISAQLRITQDVYCLYDKETKQQIGAFGYSVLVDRTTIPTSKAIVTPEKDMYVFVATPQNSSLQYQQGWLLIKEVNRQVILDPAEDAKNLETKFITTSLSGYKNFNIGDTIPLIKANGNLDLIDGKVLLKKGISKSIYNLQAYISAEGSGAFVYILKDYTHNTILQYGASVSVTSTQERSDQSLIQYAIEVTEDTLIGLEVNSFSGIKSLYVATLNVIELATSYYFNYYKDSISSKVLFEGKAIDIGGYELLDDITKYEWLEVYSNYNGTADACRNSIRIKVSDIIFRNENSSSTQNYIIINWYTSVVNNNMIYFYFIDKTHFYIQTNVSSTKEINKIEGIGFNYDNPYKDLLSNNIEDFDYTDEEISTNLNNIWGEE